MSYRKYLIGLVAGFACAAAAYFSTFLYFAPALISAEYWVPEVISVKKFLLGRVKGEHRVILLSGSNALFNFDAREASSKLGVPVFNFGLHAGMDLESILGSLAPLVRAGDTLVLPLEPKFYCIDEPSAWQVRNTIAWNPSQWLERSMQQKLTAATRIEPTVAGEIVAARVAQVARPASFKERAERLDPQLAVRRFEQRVPTQTFSYSVTNMDDTGGMLNTNGSTFHGDSPLPTAFRKVCERSRQVLGEFAKQMSARGATVYFANVPYMDRPNLKPDEIDKADHELQAALQGVGCFIDKRRDMIFDRSLFFNTNMHLNAEGRERRTRQFVEAMLPRLAPPQGAAATPASGCA